MTNLFSIFAPESWLNWPVAWLSAMAFLLFCPPVFWLAANQSRKLSSATLNAVQGEFKAALSPHSLPGMLSMSLALFAYIILNNTLGLVPYVFTASSHMSFTLALAFPLWIGHLALALTLQPGHLLAHLAPLGTPLPLLSFMVLVELVSSVIRPATLAIRLAANMMAGHLLISLLGGAAPSLPLTFVLPLLIPMVLLMLLESAVSMIQAYVFSVLSTLYINEVNSPAMAFS